MAWSRERPPDAGLPHDRHRDRHRRRRAAALREPRGDLRGAVGRPQRRARGDDADGRVRRLRRRARQRRSLDRPPCGRHRRRRRLAHHGPVLHPPRARPDRRRHRHRARRRGRHEPAPHDLVLALVPAAACRRGILDPAARGHPGARAERVLPAAAGLPRPRARRRRELAHAPHDGRPEPPRGRRAARFARCGGRQRRARPDARRAHGWHARGHRRRLSLDRGRGDLRAVRDARCGVHRDRHRDARPRARLVGGRRSPALRALAVDRASAPARRDRDPRRRACSCCPSCSIIVVLVIFARQARLPAALGLPYHRGTR